MPKYRVLATMTTDLFLELEAEDLNAAKKMAREACGSEFTEIPNSGDWDLYEVQLAEPA